MGCGSSKHDSKDDEHGSNISRRPSAGGRLSEQELLKRLDAPKENQKVDYCGLQLTYAWVSKRGYYPDSKNL